ncbi:hypothetical protein DXT97_10510 [Agrobacterium tumefaciens]|nr:hypothetical protein [Agrobacterium tumefaciens]
MDNPALLRDHHELWHCGAYRLRKQQSLSVSDAHRWTSHPPGHSV